MDITRRHDAWIAQYCTQAEELKSLITQTAAAYSTTEYGNSTANIKVHEHAVYCQLVAGFHCDDDAWLVDRRCLSWIDF